MHDPLSVAFDIKYPWRKYRRSSLRTSGGDFMKEFNRTYRSTFVTIWHKDPELRGSDDSCGWFTPPFSKTVREICKSLAFDEAREPWFFARNVKVNDDPILVERLLFGAFMVMSQCLVNRGVIRRPVSVEDATRWAAQATHNGVDNFRSSLCFVSGYHSNWYHDDRANTPEEDKWFREQQAESFFGAIAGWILRERRWWFQHPRWHVWHWQINIEPLMSFKRWAFSRCAKCGKRFTWGYAPTSHSWNSDGPQWFKSEAHVYHSDCSAVGVVQERASTEPGNVRNNDKG